MLEIDYTRYTAVQLEAARLMTNPIENLTKDEIAEHCKVSTRTLYRWLEKPEFVDLLNELSDRHMIGHVSEVDKQLIKSVKSGSVKGMELFYKRTGKLIERKESVNNVDVQITTIDGKSNEQLKKEAIEMEKRLLGDSTILDGELIDDEK